MKLNSAQWGFAFTLVSLMPIPVVEAANPPAATIETAQLQAVLRKETLSESARVDRQTELEGQVATDKSAAARWQSGLVKIGETWRPVNEFDPADSEILKEYHHQRAQASDTAESQMKLATWCRQHQLPEQERAHLWQVLNLTNKADGLILKRMGYHQIGGKSYSPFETKRVQARWRNHDDALREWRPKMERILRNWAGNPKQHQQAASDIAAIQERSAIPALYAACFSADELLTLALCERLDAIDSFESSQALAAIAVQSDSSTVCEAAAKYLKNRRLDDYAPALLSQMRTLSTTVDRSKIDLPKLVIREEAERYVAVDVQMMPVSSQSAGLEIIYSRRWKKVFNTSSQNGATLASVGRLLNDQSRNLADVNFAIQQSVEAEDDQTEAYNTKASSLLSEVTCQEPCADPRFWWAWWSIYTGMEPPKKCCHVINKQVPIAQKLIKIRYCSCLVAGTPICTDRGFVAIDKLQVGDRVLSKDLDTGELAYKLVLETTVRNPVPVKSFSVNGETITGSDGHHFWISGEGWKKTRELKPELPMHTATGMSRIESVVQLDEPASVYNLIVEDFHTYFVGKNMVLSHDVTMPAPTDVKVPGLEL